MKGRGYDNSPPHYPAGARLDAVAGESCRATVECYVPTSSHGGMAKVIGELPGTWVRQESYDELRQRATAAEARIVELEARVADLEPQVAGRWFERCKAAEAVADRLRPDALRYRWLRDRAAKLAIYSDVPVDVLIHGAWQDQPGQLDAAIDAELTGTPVADGGKNSEPVLLEALQEIVNFTSYVDCDNCLEVNVVARAAIAKVLHP